MFKNFLLIGFKSILLNLLFVTGVDAAFILQGQLSESSEKVDLIVSREHLETRKTVEVLRQAVVGGSFEIEVKEEAGLYVLRLGSASVKFVAEKKDVLQVRLNSGDLSIKGGAAQGDFLAYEAFRKESLGRLVYPVRRQLSEARKSNDQALIEALTCKEVASYNAHKAELNDFSIDKINSTAALYASSLRWKGDHRLDELELVVNIYTAEYPEAEISRLMLERIGRFRATELGATPPNLEGEGPDGTLTSLADHAGEVILIDFWAGWCGPCRITNREYVELYEEFHDDGFEIFAVSLDKNEAGWKRAIRQDKATWVHISDLIGWGSPLSESYNVSSLPSNFLLDREGRIVAKDIDGEALATLLKTLL